jgi:hypothetical protein
LSFEKLHQAWIQTIKARPIIQSPVRRSNTAPSGLEYHVRTPKGMARYLQTQTTAPDHLKDIFFLDQSKRSISDYSPAVGTNAPSGQGIFLADAADPEDQKRCTAFNAVGNIDELINSDRPAVTVQVTRFNDATLITLSISHIVGDIFAVKDILKGWESSLHGAPPTPWMKLEQDPFAAYGPGGKLAGEKASSDSPPLPPGWRIFNLVDKARFLWRLLWDVGYTRPEKTISSKYVFIPNAELDRLVEEATQDLVAVEERRKRQGEPSPTPLKLSRSNVLYAWIMKNNHAALDPTEISTPVAIVNSRLRPPTGMSPENLPPHHWWNGCYLAALPDIDVGDLMAMPLGELALYVREGTEAGSTPERAQQVISFFLHNTAWKKPTGRLAFWSPPNHVWSGLTDWRIGKLGDVDFTPARLDETQTVTSCGFHTHMSLAGTHRNRWACMGEAAGGTWIQGNISDAEWRLPNGFGRYPLFQRSARKPLSIDEYRAQEPL